MALTKKNYFRNILISLEKILQTNLYFQKYVCQSTNFIPKMSDVIILIFNLVVLKYTNCMILYNFFCIFFLL